MRIIDPQAATLDAMAAEPAVPRARLQLDWIRQRFVDPPVWQPELTDEHRYAVSERPTRAASVLIILVVRESGLNLLLTRRTAHLAHHPGQISFPGGAVEPEDQDAVQTALRESFEEIGLDPARVEVLGELPLYHTVTGYQVTPIVAAVRDLGTLTKDDNEVDEIFEVPLEFLMNGNHHQIRSMPIRGAEQPPIRRSFYAMPYRDYFIWGATAGMLRNLFHFLRA